MPAAARSSPLSRVRERVRVRARELRRDAPGAEQVIWQRLRNRQVGGWKFRRQHPVGNYFADFACVEARLIVELDGGQHFEPDAERADKHRRAALEMRGFTVLRFDNRQALAETDAVLTAILQWLDDHPPHLPCAPGLAGPGRFAGEPQAARNPRYTHNPLPQAGEGVHSRNTP